MKASVLRAFPVLLLSCLLPLAAWAQTGTTVRQQLERLKSVHAVRLVYDASLKLDVPYRGRPLDGMTLSQGLDELLRGTGLKWVAERQYIVLRPLERYTLSGYVRQDNGETIINATVWDQTTGSGTLTNEHGFFSLTLPEGFHRLRVSFVGLGERTLELTLTKDRQLDIRLTPDYRLDEVLVTADLNSPLSTTQTGKVSLTQQGLNRGFALLSSSDVVKTLQGLSGVAAGTELISGLYVHGGGNDENLFLLDGTPLYQVNHLGGLFSAFNTDIVKNIDFYKSGFPARYGGRLSSVVDVRTNDGNLEKLHGSFSLGLLDGRFQLEGPLRKGRTSFNVAMRRTWLDALTAPFFAAYNSSRTDKLNMRYAFHDINAKVTHIFSDRSRASLSFYSGNDFFKVDSKQHDNSYIQDYDKDFYHVKFNMEWGNTATTLNWEYRWTPRLFASVSGLYAHNRSNYYFLEDDKQTGEDRWQLSLQEQRSRSTIDDVGYHAELDYRPGTDHHVRMGSTYLYHLFRPQQTDNRHYAGTEEAVDTLRRRGRASYRGHEFALYAEDDIRLGDRWKLNAGLHYTLFHVSGKTFHSLEPRVAVRYQLDDRTTLKASYAEMSQFMHQLSNTYINLPTDYWVPSTDRVRPMRSRQYAAGVYRALPGHLGLSVEAYYKTMSRLVEYDGGNQLTPAVSHWESLVRTGKGKAYGVETELAYDDGQTSAAASYTLSWSRRKMPAFFSGWYPDKFDNRHKLTLSLHHRFTRRIEGYAAWNFHSGNRMTVATQLVEAPIVPGAGSDGTWEWVFDSPNNVSLPAYHRLDLGFNFRRTTKRGYERIWNVSLYNAYNHKNALYARVVRHDDGTLKGKVTGVFPILPSFSYTLKF